MIFKVREPRSTGNIHYTLSYFLFKIDPYLNKIGIPSLKQIGPQGPNVFFSCQVPVNGTDNGPCTSLLTARAKVNCYMI